MNKIELEQEQMLDEFRSNQWGTLHRAYEQACIDQDFDEACLFARKMRNKLLEESDNRMASDFPCDHTKWKQYRQHLRDITSQEGFPFEIDWGEKPETL